MIEIRNLTVAFGGVRGLNDLSADIGAKITGLVGPNGAGKTTLLNAMSGFVKCAAGTVMVDGVDLLRIAMNRRAAFGLRRTFQTEQVVENLTVWNNVAAALDNLPTGGRVAPRSHRRSIGLCRAEPPGGAHRCGAQRQRTAARRDRALHRC